MNAKVTDELRLFLKFGEFRVRHISDDLQRKGLVDLLRIAFHKGSTKLHLQDRVGLLIRSHLLSLILTDFGVKTYMLFCKARNLLDNYYVCVVCYVYVVNGRRNNSR